MQKMLNKIVKYSIYLLVFLIPLFFLPFSFEAFEINKQYLLFFLVSLAFLAWLAKMILVDREIKLKYSPLDIFVLAFLIIAALSAYFSVDHISSLLGFYGRFSNGLIGLFCLVIFYFLIVNNIGLKSNNQKESIKTEIQDSNSENRTGLISQAGLIKALLWSVFFLILTSYLSIFGLLKKLSQFLPLPQIMLQPTFNPASGSMEGLAVFLAAIAALLTGIILTEEKGDKKFKGKLKKAKIYFLLLAVFGLMAIIDFNPAWLALLLGSLLFLAIVLKRRIFKESANRLLLPIIFFILSAVFIFTNVANVQNIALKDPLPQERSLGQLASWQVGLGSATESIKSFFLGSGTGTFHYGFAKFKPVEINQSVFWQTRLDRSGSHFAEILGTMGILGMLSYLALIGMFLLVSFYLWQNKKGSELFFIFSVLLAGQLVFYQNTVLAFIFWLVLGLSVSNWQKPPKEKVVSFKNFPELSLIFLVLLTVLIVAFTGLHFYAAKIYLADSYYKNYLKANEEESLKKAINLNPYQIQYRSALVRNYLNKIIIESQKPAVFIDEEKLAENTYLAIDSAKKSTELFPNRVTSWETLAVVYREIQKVAAGAADHGIKAFEKAVALEPASPFLRTELGKLYFAAGKKDEAKKEFNKAKELMPAYLDASIQLALAYEFENEIEEAIKLMEEVVFAYPYNVNAVFHLGRLYLNNNQTDKAISQFETAISLFPNHSNSLYSLGVAYQKKGEKEKAIDYFEKALDLNPNNEDIITKLEELKKTVTKLEQEQPEQEEEESE